MIYRCWFFQTHLCAGVLLMVSDSYSNSSPYLTYCVLAFLPVAFRFFAVCIPALLRILYSNVFTCCILVLLYILYSNVFTCCMLVLLYISYSNVFTCCMLVLLYISYSKVFTYCMLVLLYILCSNVFTYCILVLLRSSTLMHTSTQENLRA